MSKTNNLPVPVSDLPVNKDDNFIGELETMNLAELKGQQFLVGINQGKREAGQFMSATIRGPYDYFEMIEEVGIMYETQQHHAKVIIVNGDRNKANKFLDENTTDYIEANWADLSAEILLEDDDVEYTCRAGINETDLEDDPRTVVEEE